MCRKALLKKLSQYIATRLPQGRHNLKRDFERKYCIWDFKNFIIFGGVFLKFFSSSHKKNNAVIQAIVAIMTTFGHTQKNYIKKTLSFRPSWPL